MDFSQFSLANDWWKLVLLIVAAVMNYGADFISKKVTEDEDKRTRTKLGLKLGAFVLAIFTAVAVVFL